MKKYFMLYSLILISLFMVINCSSSEQPAMKEKQVTTQAVQPTPVNAQVAPQALLTGENLFMQHCKKCHKNGGNIIRPEKTLYKDVLSSNNIRTPEDIVSNMRNPGKGMPKFDDTKVSDKDALAIGEYILKTFQ